VITEPSVDAANVRSGFNGTLRPGRRPALLVVDFQRGFTEPAISPLASDCSAAVACAGRMIRGFRGRGPVFYTVCGYSKNLADAGFWIQKCRTLDTLILGTAACELDPRLPYDAAEDVVINKTQASAFFGTPLASLLSARGIDMLVVTGCTTSGCIRASVVDAMQHGFPPFVVREGCSDRSAAQHESNLIDMQSKYAEVVGETEMASLLDRLQTLDGAQEVRNAE
jgi:maleamate amidohydrolase